MTSKYPGIGKVIALISFLIGTGIFGLYYLSSEDRLLFLGFVFVVVAGIVNGAVLVFLLIKAIKDSANRKGLLKTSALMLLNIPIACFYFVMVGILMNTMRITFTNTTNAELTDMNISGCETKHIDKLSSGESKTIWVGIHGDCAIYLNYLMNGERKEVSVQGYVTNDSGRKINYYIGSKNS